MSTNNSYEDWMKVLNSARKVASEDLKSSNDILAIVDKLIELDKNKLSDPSEINDISKSLVDLALNLTDNSRTLSSAISKLVGSI